MLRGITANLPPGQDDFSSALPAAASEKPFCPYLLSPYVIRAVTVIVWHIVDRQRQRITRCGRPVLLNKV